MIFMSGKGYTQIVSLEEHKEIVLDYNKSLPSGTTYIKDVNNKLDNFVGRWRGEINGKTYEIVTEKYTRDIPELGRKKDVLLMRYQIRNSSGGTIENTLDLPVESPYVVKGYYLNADTSYVFTYVGKEGQCGQAGHMDLNIVDDRTVQIRLRLSHNLNTPQNCPNGAAVQVFPTTDEGGILKKV